MIRITRLLVTAFILFNALYGRRWAIICSVVGMAYVVEMVASKTVELMARVDMLTQRLHAFERDRLEPPKP